MPRAKTDALASVAANTSETSAFNASASKRVALQMAVTTSTEGAFCGDFMHVSLIQVHISILDRQDITYRGDNDRTCQ